MLSQKFERRLTGIDLLRALSILLVLLLHWHLCGSAAPASSWIDQFVVKLSTYGNYGITLFFVISGFLIMRNIRLREPDVHRLSPRDFYIRRIARIQPLLIASISFGVVMLAFTGPSAIFHWGDAVFDAAFWISLFTFTFNWVRVFHSGAAGGWGVHWDVMWSLAVEEQFYLLLPLILIWSKNAHRLTSIALGVIVVGMISRETIAWTGVTGWEYLSPACFDALAIGVLCTQIAQKFDSRCSARFMAIGGITIIVGAYSGDFLPPLSFLVVELGAGIFILGAQASRFTFGRAWQLPAWIGQLSYEIYLLHPAVLYFIAPHLKGWSFSASWLVFSGITAGASYVIHQAFTEPMNVWLRDKMLKRRERIADILQFFPGQTK